MKEHTELFAMMDNAAARRLWILYKALYCFPLDRALDLARAAEGFVMAGLDSSERRIPELFAGLEGCASAGQRSVPELGDNPPAESETGRTTNPGTTAKERAVEWGIPDPTAEVEGVAAGQQGVPELGDKTPAANETGRRATMPEARTKKRAVLYLTREQRARLIERLAEGAKNAELAGEFGLSRKQVQGIRMGCAREIAKRREHIGEASSASEPDVTVSVEEVVRYLRQQDDVVVPQEDGGFLLNGRFHMGVSELVERANRMRIRQQKPAFKLPARASAQTKSFTRTNGHPVFWREAPAAVGSGA